MRDIPTATKHLLIVNCLLYLAVVLTTGRAADGPLDMLMLYYPTSEHFHWWQYVTYMFMHGGFMHLFFNMYALSAIGPAVDYVCGPVIFLIVYLGAGLSGNIATMILDGKRGSSSLSAGASGCIFGLLGACFVLAIAGYGFSMRSILTTLAINLIYGLSSKRINMMSHVGGFIGGAAIMAVIMAVF